MMQWGCAACRDRDTALIELGRPILAPLDRALDWCVENWRALAVLMPAATFLAFALFIFLGLSVGSALATTKTLALIQLVGATTVLVLNMRYRRQLTQRHDAADAIGAMIGGEDVFSEWDEFLSTPAADREVERIRRHCLSLPREFPPQARGAYCGEQGMRVLRGYALHLRAGLATRGVEALTAWCRGRPAEIPAPDESTDIEAALDAVEQQVAELLAATPIDEPAPEPAGARPKKSAAAPKAGTTRKKKKKTGASKKKAA